MTDSDLIAFYSGKHVLVTGSAGFIGGRLVYVLRKMGAIIHGYDIKTRICDNILRTDKLHPLINDFKPDVVFHLAGETEVGLSLEHPALFYNTNVTGTLNVLEGCRRYVPKTRVVVASTDKVYGPHLDPPEEGSRKERTNNPYSESKRLADEMCETYYFLYKMPIRVLRSVNTYGPGQTNRTTLITNTVMRVMEGARPLVTQPSVKREWLYIEDAVNAYLGVGAIGTHQFAFNVGTRERLTQIEVVRAVLSAMGKNADSYDFDTITLDAKDYSQHVNATKFRSWFPNWVPVPFDEGIKKTVEWYQNQQQQSKTVEDVK